MFDQFHGNEVVPRSFLLYFVTLIPKVNNPFTLKQFRPISLLGCLYKLLEKVLAGRMSMVMSSIISSSQSTFVKGRNLVDGVSVINEVVDVARRMNRECLILKVDFEKANDTVDWSFLEYMLRRVGFCSKWINWMKACVFGGNMPILVNGSPTEEICIERGLKQGDGGNMSILVNGSPTEEICIERGLKQGDLLAPFLFLLVSEGFSGLMRNVVNSNSFTGFDLRSNGLVVSHLQYADDTLCIGEASVDNLWTLKALLIGFEMASGLKVNFAKSCLIGVNVGREFMEAACNFMNCREGFLPFKYLDLPVGANPRRMSTWEPLLDCLKKGLILGVISMRALEVGWSFLMRC